MSPSRTKPISLRNRNGRAASRQRRKLLAAYGVADRFVEGTIAVDGRLCRGVECRLCVSACPTGALFWQNGKVAVVEELCIFCGACVLNCIVDDCIRITRKRANGEAESFSRPKDFVTLEHSVDAAKRLQKVEEAFPKKKRSTKHKSKRRD